MLNADIIKFIMNFGPEYWRNQSKASFDWLLVMQDTDLRNNKIWRILKCDNLVCNLGIFKIWQKFCLIPGYTLSNQVWSNRKRRSNLLLLLVCICKPSDERNNASVSNASSDIK